jgi:hypothetical protein
MLRRVPLALVLALPLACRSGSSGDTELGASETQPGSESSTESESESGNETESESGNETETDTGDTTDTSDEELVWPNADAPANSDPWLVEHHDEITQLRPRVLALNFVNAKSMADMQTLLERIVDGFAEGSRHHGYEGPDAPISLQFELAYLVDLRDVQPPANWPYNNSTLYPREDPQDGYWSFDYEQLFSEPFADLYGITDPADPGGGTLSLCELVERGLVHEVWVYGDADVPDVSAAEVLGIKPFYDTLGQRLDQPLDRCAGNGCFDDEDAIPAACTRSLRIGWVNATRGPGCYLHSNGHGMEAVGRGNTLPMLRPQFVDFAGLDLDTRYGLPFADWYACNGPDDCLSYPTETSVEWSVAPNMGTIDPYPHCGNVHFAPNARNHYDNPPDITVQTTCRDWWSTPGGEADPTMTFSTALLDVYAQYDDCGGPWQVWWMQSWPGFGNTKLDAQGQAVHSWWPYLFY